MPAGAHEDLLVGALAYINICVRYIYSRFEFECPYHCNRLPLNTRLLLCVELYAKLQSLTHSLVGTACASGVKSLRNDMSANNIEMTCE